MKGLKSCVQLKVSDTVDEKTGTVNVLKFRTL